MDTAYKPINFVSPYAPGQDQPTPAAPETSLIRRQDVVNTVQSMIGAYADQQRRVLTLEGEIVTDYDPDGRSAGAHGFSTAAELEERRKTARLYLRAQFGVSALTIGGLAYLAYLGGAIDRPGALAVWAAGTGAISLVLMAWQHRQELKLTPEAIEHARIGSSRSIGEIDATSRQIIAEAYADAIRGQAETDRIAQETKRQAAAAETQRLIAQMERRADDRGRTRRAMYDAWPAPATPEPTTWRPGQPTAGRQFAIVGETEPTVRGTDRPTVTTVPATVDTDLTPFDSVTAAAMPAPTVDPALRVLLDTLTSLYETVDPSNPLIKSAIPWSARSTAIPPADKTRIGDLLQRLDPPLIEQRAGGRYYLNLGDYPSPKRTARILAAAWT